MKLPLEPSEYIKRQVYATFIEDPVFVDLLDWFPADNIMWSSDYPHRAATFPRSRSIVAKHLGKLPRLIVAQDRPRYRDQGVRYRDSAEQA